MNQRTRLSLGVYMYINAKFAFWKLRTFWSKLCKSIWIGAWNHLLTKMESYVSCESVYFQEPHNNQEYYWPTTYRGRAAVVSTNSVVLVISYRHENKKPHVLRKLRSFWLYFVIHFVVSQRVVVNHRWTIKTFRGIVMSRASCDPIHLLYFITPTLGFIQVLSRNASQNTELCTFWSQMLIWWWLLGRQGPSNHFPPFDFVFRFT